MHEPQSGEGRAALRVALSPGIWRRAGMDGALAGIDWIGARTLAAGQAQGHWWPLIARLLARFETGALLGDARRRKKDKEES